MARRKQKGRGRLSSIELLPKEASHIVSWALRELAARERSQVDIYAEFRTKCTELMEEGVARFDIPSSSAFNRAALRQAELSRRMAEVGKMAEVLAERFDADASDRVTITLAEAMKSTIYEMQVDGQFNPKQLLEFSAALKNLVQAQNMSAQARRKQDAENNTKLSAAIDEVAKTKGLTADTAEAIKAQILGIQK